VIALAPDLVRSTQALGWTDLTPIQELAIPPLRQGRDVLAEAQTGTGKTGAFGIPLVERIAGRAGAPFAIIIVPTRELAQQVAREVSQLGRYRGAQVAALYGGVGYAEQERSLRRGAHVVVGTPGRVLDLVTRGTLDLRSIGVLVLDEADRLLDLGFAPDLARIAAQLPADRRTWLFSATLTEAVRATARRYTTDPVNVAAAKAEDTAAVIDQAWIQVREADKVAALRQILSRRDVGRTLVFRRTKYGADKLVRALEKAGVRANALHSNVSQRQRERVLDAFKRGSVTTLVATNLAARGIHVDDVGHVVNFDLPENAETYVHRVGRTGRAGRSGVAFTFVNETQRAAFDDIRRRAKVPFRQERLAAIGA
jgi:superfamily II DNA/RNA helicase